MIRLGCLHRATPQRPGARSESAIRLSAFAALACLAWSFPAAGQVGEPVLTLTEPAEWRDGRSVVVAPNSTLRVRGVASHPGGVAQVLVGGAEATLRPDPEFPNLVNFEATLTASTPGPVRIRIVPRSGSAYERDFDLQLDPPPVPARQPATPVQPAEREQVPVRSSPWGGFWLRTVLYGAAAAGGVVLAMQEEEETSEVCREVGGGLDCFQRTEFPRPNQALGLGLVGAAAAATLIDLLLTSRRGGSFDGDSDGDGAAAGALRIGSPAVGVEGDRVQLELLRLRF